MSSGGQIVGGIVGAVVGYYVGGPAGALQGAAIGSGVGGYLDPPKGPTIEGPRLNDLSVQTSTYGQFIPRTYGTIGLSGNVFWLENNKIKEVVKKKKSGGKGGGSSSTVKTYTYFATFAVGLCEGPIAGVRRIWVGPDLVYDAGSDDLETIISSNKASSNFKIYLGTDTQQPDSRIQADMGVSNCPSYRGLAYIVVKDLLLTNYGNSVAGAQVKVEVVNSASISGLRKLSDVAVLGFPTSYTMRPYQSGDGYVSSFYAYDPYAGYTFVNGEYIPNDERIVGITVQGDLAKYVPQISNPIRPQIVSTGSITVQAGRIGELDVYIPEYFSTFAILSGRSIIPTGMLTGRNTTAVSGSGNDLTKNLTTETGRYLQGMAISNSGDMCLIVTFATRQQTIMNADRYFIVGADAALIDSGIVVGDTLGVFQAASTTANTNGSICFDSVSMTGWSITAPGPSQIRAAYFSISAGVLTSTALAAESVVGAGYASGAYFDGVFYASYKSAGVQRWATYTAIKSVNPQQVPLSTIVATEAVRSALIKPSDIDTAGLTDSVTGFKVTATGSIRNAIEPLRGAWPFDVVQSGYKIKATSRGTGSVVTIPIGELAIDTQLTESREMDSQLPQNVTVKYIDRDRDYDHNEQRAQRDNTEAVNSLVLELPVVLSATQSAQVADKLIRIYALEKSDFSFTLPAPYRYLEPGDVVTIAADDADYVLRLVSVNQTADGRLECAGRPSSAATYTSIAPGDGGQQGAVTIPLAGATVGLIVDCPVIDEGLQDAPGFAVGMNGYSAGWPGGILYRTDDNGQTWDDLQALDGRATAGYAAGVLAASAGNLIQRGGSLTISLIGGTLESVTEAQMLNGANIAAYGVNGRWEILRFQNATLNGDGTYTLDTFWRGDKGTEWATGLHDANDIFVLMTDPDLAFVGMPTDSIGQPRDYRAVTAGADIDSAASQALTYSAVNLETLSGVHPRGSRSAGDLTITWQRRTRVGGAWRDYVDASLGEATESYEVDIMDGATVKRTITATTPSVLYTSAMQVTDFGSPQASVTVNIYQLSAVVGRGYKLEATL